MWLPAQDQARQHSSHDRGEAHKAPPLAESYWQLITAGEGRELVAFRGVASGRLLMLMDGPILVCGLEALVGFSWLFLKSKKKRRDHEGGRKIH